MSQIRLNYVELKNFKKHELLEVEFGDSLTVIKGPNYAGKSSVFQAVYFALFGTKAVPGGRAVIVRNGSKSCLVTLQFMIGERNFIIERGLTSASLSEQLQTEDGGWTDTLIATGPSTVTEWVEANLGQNAQQYLLLTYSRQGTAAGLLDFGAPALNRVIESLANADYVEKLILACGKRAQQASALLEALGPGEDPAPLRTRHIEAQRAEAGAQMKLGQARAKESAAKNQEEAILLALKEAEAKDKQIRDSQLLIERLNAGIESFVGERGKLMSEWDSVELPNLEELANNAIAYRQQYESLVTYKASYDSVVKEIERMKKLVISLDYSEMASLVQDQYDAAKKAADKAFADQVQIETEYSDVQREHNKAATELKLAVCSACKRPFDASHTERMTKTVQKLKEELDAILPKLEAAREHTTKTQKKVDAIKLPPAGWREPWEQAKQKLQELEEEFEGSEPCSDEDIEDAKRDYNQAVSVGAEAKGLHKAKEKALQKISELNDKINESKARHDEIQAKLESIEAPDLDSTREHYQKARDELRALSDARQDLERQHAGFSAQLQALTGELERVERGLAKRRAAEVDLDRFQRLQRWLRDSKATFLGQIWEAVLSVTSAFAKAATFGVIEEVARSPEGDFSYREGGAELPIEAASGGQRSIIGIGLRLALASLLPQGAGLLVLDEPSAELNDEHAAALAGTLKAQGIQILLVTHREGEEFAADKTVVLGE